MKKRCCSHPHGVPRTLCKWTACEALHVSKNQLEKTADEERELLCFRYRKDPEMSPVEKQHSLHGLGKLKRNPSIRLRSGDSTALNS